jgi:hypothetical protein
MLHARQSARRTERMTALRRTQRNEMNELLAESSGTDATAFMTRVNVLLSRQTREQLAMVGEFDTDDANAVHRMYMVCLRVCTHVS